jgi:hypothetical protein
LHLVTTVRAIALIAVLGLYLLPYAAPVASAASIFESASLGQTGITAEQVRTQEVFGTHVSEEVFGGARFQVTKSWQVTRIGGHFVGRANDSFFGAIVRLSNSADFPDSSNLSTPDVLGVTNLEFSDPSAEVFGNIAVTLQPGWHAVVFGSGLFGATGSGAAVFNGVDVGSPAYIGWQPGSTGWWELPDFFDHHRYIIEGTVVPEPFAAPLAMAMIVLFLGARRGWNNP